MTRQPVDLGPLIVVSVIGMGIAALVAGDYFLKKKGLSLRDLLGRKPLEE